MRRSVHFFIISGAVMVTAVIGAQRREPVATWSITHAPPALHEYISQADLIVVAMHEAMQREVTKALLEGGPVDAIRACHVDVDAIVARVARREGVAAGRTSDRPHNPLNVPKQWAAPLVRTHAGRSARTTEGFIVDLGDAVGVLRPIVHQPTCDACHGVRIDPQVRAAIARRYPGDQATGFLVGAIRGWYWVEIPRREHR